MNEKKLLLIYNPYSGRKEFTKNLHQVVDYFTASGYRVTLHPTQRDNDGYQVTKKWAHQYDLLVCAGGDGSLNEVIHGLMEQDYPEKRPLLGYLPSGSTNDFASSHKIPTDPLAAAKAIVEGTPIPLDIGQLEDRYFSYIAAFGLFTSVSYDTPQGMKNLLGHAAYLLEGVKRLTNIQTYPCTITCDEEQFEEEFLLGMLTNSASVGGFRLPADQTTGEDKAFTLILLRKLEDIFDLQGIISTLLGFSEPGEKFIIRRANSVQVRCHQPLAWTLDGEYGGQYTQSSLQVHKAAVELVVLG